MAAGTTGPPSEIGPPLLGTAGLWDLPPGAIWGLQAGIMTGTGPAQTTGRPLAETMAETWGLAVTWGPAVGTTA